MAVLTGSSTCRCPPAFAPAVMFPQVRPSGGLAMHCHKNVSHAADERENRLGLCLLKVKGW